MKSFKSISVLAVSALLMTACSQNEDFETKVDNFPADHVIRVATEVVQPMNAVPGVSKLQSRAGMSTDNLNEFYLKVDNVVNSNYTFFAKMKLESGVWQSYKPGAVPEPLTMLWQNKTESVIVYAVKMPLELTSSDWDTFKTFSVNQDQTTEENLKNSDVLYMDQRVVSPAMDLTSDGKMQIAMRHRLSKINLTLKLGTEFNIAPSSTDINPIASVKVEGSKTSVEWNIASNLMQNESVPEFISPFLASYVKGEGETKMAEAKYECVIIPQTLVTSVNPFSVSIIIGGKTYFWQHSSPSITFNENTQYNLTLIVGKDVVTLGGFSTTPWTVGATYDVETE